MPASHPDTTVPLVSMESNTVAGNPVAKAGAECKEDRGIMSGVLFSAHGGHVSDCRCVF